MKLSFSGNQLQVKFTWGFQRFATYYEVCEGNHIRFILAAPCRFKVHIPRRETSPRQCLLESTNFNEAVVVYLDAVDELWSQIVYSKLSTLRTKLVQTKYTVFLYLFLKLDELWLCPSFLKFCKWSTIAFWYKHWKFKRILRHIFT